MIFPTRDSLCLNSFIGIVSRRCDHKFTFELILVIETTFVFKTVSIACVVVRVYAVIPRPQMDKVCLPNLSVGPKKCWAKFPHSPILHYACGPMYVVLCFTTKKQQKQRIVLHLLHCFYHYFPLTMTCMYNEVWGCAEI